MGWFGEVHGMESLEQDQLAFFGQLVEMLDKVRPSGAHPERSSAKVVGRVLTIVIAHRAEQDLVVSITAEPKEIVVGTLGDHHHFSPEWEDYSPGREEHHHPWYSYATGYVADLLCGLVEIETTYKGRIPVHSKVTHFDEHGAPGPICHEGIPLVWRLIIFPRTRREVRRPTFME